MGEVVFVVRDESDALFPGEDVVGKHLLQVVLSLEDHSVDQKLVLLD